MLQSINHPDVRVADIAAVGFNITGNVPPSGVFEARTAYKSIPGNGCGDERWTSDASWWKTPRLKGKPTREWPRKSTIRPWRKLPRVKGWAPRPHAPDKLMAMLGPRWIPSRRSGIVEGGKTRPIDAFNKSLVNRAVSCLENMSVDGFDRVADMAKMWVGSAAEFRRCRSGPQHRQGPQGMQESLFRRL